MAAALDQSPDDLAERLWIYCQTRGCYAAAWRYAAEREGVDPAQMPACVRR